jgi:hypothetical protein
VQLKAVARVRRAPLDPRRQHEHRHLLLVSDRDARERVSDAGPAD